VPVKPSEEEMGTFYISRSGGRKLMSVELSGDATNRITKITNALNQITLFIYDPVPAIY
jgi:hypothetical protein